MYYRNTLLAWLEWVAKLWQRRYLDVFLLKVPFLLIVCKKKDLIPGFCDKTNTGLFSKQFRLHFESRWGPSFFSSAFLTHWDMSTWGSIIFKLVFWTSVCHEPQWHLLTCVRKLPPKIHILGQLKCSLIKKTQCINICLFSLRKRDIYIQLWK